ncbi:nucleotidyltransferase family protein [Desulfothermus naphthae]
MVNREVIIKELQKIKEKYKDKIIKIGIFGSVARNEYNQESDIDVVVEQKYLDLFLLGRIKIELKEKFNKNVDIIRLRNDINPFLKKRIERDSIYE